MRRDRPRGRLDWSSPPTLLVNEGRAVDQPVSNELKQSRMTEFMKLLPLTVELAARALLKEVGETGLQ